MEYYQKKEPLVIAINEGVLLTCAQESNDEIAQYLIDSILYQYIKPRNYEKFSEEGKLDAKMADDLYQAAKAAAVCVRGA